MSLCLKCHKKAEIKCKQCSENFCKLDWELDHGTNCVLIAGKNGKPRLVFCSTSRSPMADIIAYEAPEIFQSYFPDCEVVGAPGADLERMQELKPDVIFVVLVMLGMRPDAGKDEVAYMNQFKPICQNVMFLQIQLANAKVNSLNEFEPKEYDGGFALGTKSEVRLAPRLIYSAARRRLTRDTDGTDLSQNKRNLQVLKMNIANFASRGPVEQPSTQPSKPQPSAQPTKPQPSAQPTKPQPSAQPAKPQPSAQPVNPQSSARAEDHAAAVQALFVKTKAELEAKTREVAELKKVIAFLEEERERDRLVMQGLPNPLKIQRLEKLATEMEAKLNKIRSIVNS